VLRYGAVSVPCYKSVSCLRKSSLAKPCLARQVVITCSRGLPVSQFILLSPGVLQLVNLHAKLHDGSQHHIFFCCVASHQPKVEPADSRCRFVKPPQDEFDRRPDYPPQQQQQGQGAFNRQGSYHQQQGPGQPPGFQRKPSFNQDQAYGGRPDFKQRQQQGYGARDAPPAAARRRRQFSVSISNMSAL